MSLREHIADEIEWDREPDFAELDDPSAREVFEVIYNAITQVMVATHADEAARLQAESDALVEATKAAIEHPPYVEVHRNPSC